MLLNVFSIYWELEKLNMSDKKSYSIEYDFHSSPQLLFQYLSTPSGLSEWFADNVNSRGEMFTFIWNDSEEHAKMIQKKIIIKFVFNGKIMMLIKTNTTSNLKFK